MGYIDNLLRGRKVEWKTLGEVAEVRRGERVTKRELNTNSCVKFPVFSGGVTPMGFYTKHNQAANTITVVKYGTAGFVNFITEEFWANDVCYCIKPLTQVNNKYLFYILKNKQELIYSLTTEAIPKHLPSFALIQIPIPLPPLDVQVEIARILDRFSALEAELEAELEARQKQYEYYRDRLLTFDKTRTDVEWKTLGEVAEYTRGVTYNKHAEIEKGEGWKVLRANNISLETRQLILDDIKLISKEIRIRENQHLYKGDILICAGSGSKEHVGKTAYIDKDLEYVFGGFMGVIRSSNKNKLLPRFLFHHLGSLAFSTYLEKALNASTINNLNASIMKALPIPLPPPAEQERIVRILDKFSTLTTSLTAGLPREIALRRQQYEYYREQLLSFE